jgi:hypothetical protein
MIVVDASAMLEALLRVTYATSAKNQGVRA